MDQQAELGQQVRRWIAEGKWIDRGRWKRSKNCETLEYLPTRREIKAKCKLFRAIPDRYGTMIRCPRDGEYAVPSTAGL